MWRFRDTSRSDVATDETDSAEQDSFLEVNALGKDWNHGMTRANRIAVEVNNVLQTVAHGNTVPRRIINCKNETKCVDVERSRVVHTSML